MGMASLEEVTTAIQQLQAQMAQAQAENTVLRERLATFEASQGQSPQHGGAQAGMAEVLQALRELPTALTKLGKPKGLIDHRGLGKPQILGDDAENKFRLWSVKLEDYAHGVFGGKSREVMEWASAMDAEITENDIMDTFGINADDLDRWEDIDDFNSQLYSVLRATTESVAFDVVENVTTGQGLEAWRALHRRFDPATGSRKRIMLQALTNPERASYDSLQSALERWKALKSRYDKKRDQFGQREALPDSLAMNALEKLVPKELETHLLLNHTRFRSFDDMEREVVNYMEVKTGSRMTLSANFAKSSGGSGGTIPMDVDSLAKAVSGTLASLAKGKGHGKNENHNKMTVKFDGTCNNCGKHGHRSRDCWSKPKGGKGQPASSTSRSASSSPKKGEKFNGKCNNCGKVGHKKADCWATPGKGKGNGKSDNNKKGHNAASVQDLPEPEPQAAANGLELCSLVELNTLTVAKSRPSRRRRRSSSRTPEVVERPFNENASRSRDSSRARTEVADENEETIMVTVDQTEEEWSPDSLPSIASTTAVDPEWVRCNLDTGASLTVFPKKMFEVGEEETMKLKTASGEVINAYGNAVLRGEDTKGVMRKLNGQVADVHKVLASAAKMHDKGYVTWLGTGGGEIIPCSHPVNKAMNEAYQKAVWRFGKEGIIPVAEEDGVYNFYLKEKIPDQDAVSPHSPEGPPPSMSRPSSSSGTMTTTLPSTRTTGEVRAIPRRSEAPPEPAGVPRRERTRSPRFACALEEEVDVPGGGEELVISEGVEARPANPGWSPPTPTPEEKKEHEASGHAVYRSWCTECVAATGYGQQHRRVPHQGELLNTVVMDYWYLTDAEGARPHLVAQDRKTGMQMATSLREKGDGETSGRKLLARFLELLGYKEVVLKSDGEHALVKMKKAAGKEAKCLTKVVCEESPVGDARANGEAEAAVREVKWRVRAITMSLKKKYPDIPEDHPLLLWVPRYAAEQSNRYRVGADGRTAEERRTGKKWIKPMPVFGERIMIKPAGRGKRGDQTRMKPARFLGCHSRFGSVLGMTTEGVVVGTSYHSLPEDEKWTALEENLKGSPWDVRAYVRRQLPEQAQPAEPQPQVVIVQPALGPALQQGVPGQDGGLQDGGEGAAGDNRPMVGGPSASSQQGRQGVKAWPVRREYLTKFGRTDECPGCLSLMKGAGFQQVAHSSECRQRIKRCLDEAAASDDAEVKRLREEDRLLEEAVDPQGSVPMAAEPAQGSAGGELNPEAGVAAPEASGGTKRKGGEEGVVDVDDLCQEAEADGASSVRAASIQAMTLLIGSYEAAKNIADLAAMDVVEVFSPERMNKEVERFGLRKGIAVDLEEMKPDGSERWNLDKDEDFQLLLEILDAEKPWLVTSSPPCTTFSPLRRLSNHKRLKETVEQEEMLGRLRLRRSIRCCKRQARLGGFYLHEHPRDATSWKEGGVEELVNDPNSYLVQSPMCRFGMKLKNDERELLHVRKETLWLTNSEEIAKELKGVCENDLKGREVHRHVHLVGANRAKAAQVYPVALVEAVLRGLKRELEKMNVISALEEQVSGPSPDDMVS